MDRRNELYLASVSPLRLENEEQHTTSVLRLLVYGVLKLFLVLNGGLWHCHEAQGIWSIYPSTKFLNLNQLKLTLKNHLTGWLTLARRCFEHHHYMTDKYNYEAVQKMAFLPTHQRCEHEFGICGIALLIHCQYQVRATVKPIRDENGYIWLRTMGWKMILVQTGGWRWLVGSLHNSFAYKLYKNAEASILLTITSNVAYKQTGNSPVHKGPQRRRYCELV